MAAQSALVSALREAILDGRLAPGARLTERELVETHAVARHTARTALRALAGEGLVTVEANRGARVAALDADSLRGLFELRAALELESAHRMLARTGGRASPELVVAVEHLEAVCARSRPPWGAVVDAHDGVHSTLVAAGRSARITTAYDALGGELRLFVVALRPAWERAQMAAHHRALLEGLEAHGVPALRRHLDEGEAVVLAHLAARG